MANTKETKQKPEKPKEARKVVKDQPEAAEPKAEIVAIEETIVPANYKSKLTNTQVELIKNTIAKGATDDELKMFLYVCERTRLDPFTKQIHLVPRWDSRLGKEVRTPIVGIDGLRSIAERTAEYAGNNDPVFDDETKPTKATVSVFKIVQGVRSEFTASARWSQYYPGPKQGFMWDKMPHLMLGKCAEALALRKAFPAVMSGLYVAEEMAQATGGATIGAPVQAAPAVESNFDKASRIISNMTDVAALEETKNKLLGSDKYTIAEKSKIEELISARTNQLKRDATATVPKAQHAKDAGDKPGEL